MQVINSLLKTETNLRNSVLNQKNESNSTEALVLKCHFSEGFEQKNRWHTVMQRSSSSETLLQITRN